MGPVIARMIPITIRLHGRSQTPSCKEYRPFLGRYFEGCPCPGVSSHAGRTSPNNESTEAWPRWYSQFNEPIVYRHIMPYSYVVLPQPR